MTLCYSVSASILMQVIDKSGIGLGNNSNEKISLVLVSSTL